MDQNTNPPSKFSKLKDAAARKQGQPAPSAAPTDFKSLYLTGQPSPTANPVQVKSAIANTPPPVTGIFKDEQNQAPKMDMPGTVGESVGNFRANQIGAVDESFDAYKERIGKISPALIQGAGYNLKGAYEGGLEPEKSEDGNFHLGSRNPITGELLKSKDHPTYQKMIDGEKSAGYDVYEQDGKLFSKQNNPEAAKPVKPKVEKSFWENAVDGFWIGLEDLKGNTARGVSEMIDLAGTTPSMGVIPGVEGQPKFGEYSKLKKAQAEGKAGAFAPSLDTYADGKTAKTKEMMESREADPDSWGYMVGSLIPQGAGIATAVAVGSVSPIAGAAIGAASTGQLTSMAIGGAAQEYDEYVAERGGKYDPNERLGAMALSAAAETISEVIPVAKFIPKQFRGKLGKLMFGNTEIISKKGAELIKEFAESSTSRMQMVKNLAREAGEGAVVEGATEPFAELGNEFSTWLYKEKKDRATFTEMAERAAKALVGGSIMGAGIGPMSYGAQRFQNSQRRQEAGKVVIAQDNATGEALEIVGMVKPPKDGVPTEGLVYEAIRPNGKMIQVAEDQVGTVVDMSLSDFDELIKGKAKGGQMIEQQANDQVSTIATTQIDQFRSEFEPYAIPTPMGPVVGMAQHDGEDVFVLQDQPNNNVLIQAPGQERKIVPVSSLSGTQFLPFDQFMAQYGPVPQEAVAPFDPSNPVQTGEEVAIEGQNFVVTGVNYETGQVALELEDGDSVDVMEMPLEAFQSLRKPAEVPQTAEPTPPASAPADSGAAKLRELFPTEEQKKQLEANKKASELVPALGGEQQVENEILGNEPAPAAATEPESLPAPAASPEQAGVGLTAVEDAPAQPASEGVNPEIPIAQTAAQLINQPSTLPTTATDDQLQQTEPLPEAGQDDVQVQKDQENSPQEVQGQEGLGGSGGVKPIKGQVIFDPKKNKKATVTRVFKPKKGSALENERYLMDVTYEDGKKAMNMPGSKFQANPSQNPTEKKPQIKASDLLNQPAEPKSESEVGFTVFGSYQTGTKTEDGSYKSKDGTVYTPAMVDNITDLTDENREKSNRYERFAEKEREAGIRPDNAGPDEKPMDDQAGSGTAADDSASNPAGDQQSNTDGPDAGQGTQDVTTGGASPDGDAGSVDLQTELDTVFGPIADKAKNPIDFMTKARKIKGVSPELSQYFFDKYGKLGNTGDKANTADQAALAYLQERDPKKMQDYTDQLAAAKNKQAQLNDANEQKSKAGKEQSRKAAEMLNDDFETRAYAGLSAEEKFEAVIEDKLASQLELTPKELQWANENMFLPQGFELDKSGNLIEKKPEPVKKAANMVSDPKPKPDKSEVDKPEVDKPAPKSAASLVSDTAPQPAKDKFKDVGEKIGGAKKDTYTKQTTNLELNTLQRLIDEPLSKTIPEPDYKQLVADGLISENDAIALKLTRELLGRKPTKPYRIQRWAEQAQVYSEWMEKTLKGEPIVAGKSISEVIQQARQLKEGSWGLKQWAEQVALYQKINWITTGTTPGVYQIKGEGDQRYVVKGQYIVSGRGNERMTFAEAAEWIAITRLKELAKERESGGNLWKFKVYQDRTTKDIYIERANFPGIRLKQGFTTGKEAHTYIKDNYKDLVDSFNTLKDIPEDRRADNNSRIGQDHRNGRNIASAEEFMETFGLRAVEFGNWVNAQERQDSINKAYDALMDMALILKVPPKALGLNGELGLAFGARGSKGAAAHYESAKKVINLTKESGAGSLAHEWWHAFDNYLSRNRNEPGGFMSERAREFIADSKDPRGLSQDPTRKEIFAAFNAINKVINRKGGQWERSQLRDNYKSKKYYQTPREMTARAFESYVIDRLATQNTVNDYLANIAAEEDYTRQEVYPYPTKEEKKDLFAGFDQLFTTMKVDQANPKMPMYMLADQSSDNLPIPEGSNISRPKAMSEPAPNPKRASDLIKTPALPTQAKQVSKVQAEADRITGTWKNGPAIEVYPNGAAIEAAFPAVQFRDMDRVPALYFDGKVILNAAHPFHNQPGGTETLVLHESIGHFGLNHVINQLSAEKGLDSDQVYGKLMTTVFDQYQDTALMAHITKTYFGKDPASLNESEQIEAGEEYIAHTAQTGVKDKFIDRVISKIRDILRDLGFQLKMADSELRAIIGRASRFVVDGPGRVEMQKQLQPAMMLTSADQTQTPAFKAWFGDSKVVDSEGKPLVVYHGTDNDFNEFKSGFNNAIFFTSDKEISDSYGKVNKEVFLSIQNPLEVATSEAWAEAMSDKTTKEKYDGIIYNGTTESGSPVNAIAVFSPTQIKSATGNVGTFSQTNPDIRYTKTPNGSGIRMNDFVSTDKQTRVQNRLENSPNFLANPRYMVDPAGVETKAVEKQRRKGFFAKAKFYFSGKNPNKKENKPSFREDIQDAMLPARRMLEGKFGKNIPEEQDFYTKENLAADKVVFQIGQMENKHMKPIKDLADQIQKDYDVTFEQIEDYLIALHNQERRDELTAKHPKEAEANKDSPEWPTGMTTEEANKIIAEYEAIVPPAERDQMNALVKDLVNFSLDKRKESGLISEKYYEQLKNQYQHYVPLRGFEDHIEYDVTKYSPLKQAKGRKSKAASPLAYLYADAADAIAHGERNKVFQSMLEFAKKNPDNRVFQIKTTFYRKAKKEDGSQTWIEFNEEEARPDKEELEKGTAIRGFNPEIMKDIAMSKVGDLTLPVWVNGQRVTIQFKSGNEQLVKALKNTSYSKIEGFLKLSQKLNGYLSSAFTEYSPEFGVVNAMRDFGMGGFSIMADDGFDVLSKTTKKYLTSMKALGNHFWNNQDLTKSTNPYLREFLESGAFTGFSQAKEVRDVYMELSNQSVGKKLADSTLAKVVSSYNKSMENALRFAYFQTLRESGLSMQKAAAKAKDVTVNFRRRGNMTSNIGALYAFFNASVQGIERFTRPFFQNGPAKRKAQYMAGTLFVSGFMQGLLFNLYGGIDEEDDELKYDKIPGYTKAMNIILPAPTDSGYITIPLGYGINVPFALGELFASVILGKTKAAEAVWRMLTISSDSFSPLGGYDFDDENRSMAQKVAQFATPTYARPVLDLAINTNFAGFQIVQQNPWDKGTPNSQSGKAATSTIAVKAAELINSATGGDEVVPGLVDINPTAMEYLIRQYGGGPLSFAQKLTKTGELLFEGENPLVGDGSRKVPFSSRFYQDADNSSATTSSYFKVREQVQIAQDRYEKYLKADKEEKAEEFYQKNQPLIEAASVLESYDKALKSMRKEMNAVRESDPDYYKELKQEQEAVMKEFNQVYRLIKGEKQIRARDLLGN